MRTRTVGALLGVALRAMLARSLVQVARRIKRGLEPPPTCACGAEPIFYERGVWRCRDCWLPGFKK